MIAEQSEQDIWGEHRKQIEHLLLDQASELSLLVDLETMKIRGARGPIAQVLGYDPAKIVGMEIGSLRPRQRTRRLMTFGPALLCGPAFYGEVGVGCRDGSQRTMALRVQPLEGEGPALALLRLVDMTEQVRLNGELSRMHRALQDSFAELARKQKSLDEARRAASLSQFAAGLAHEMNNPIGSALSNLSSLDSYLKDLVKDHFSNGNHPEELDEIVAISRDVRSSLRRVAEIVGLLRELEEPLRQADFDLVEIVASLVEQSENTELQASGAAIMSSDAEAILRLTGRIIDNARRAAGPRGVVRVTIDCKDDRVVLQVDDSGPGLPAEIEERVFDPFFTTRSPGQGLGLGLFLVRRAVSILGGEASLQNLPGGGARAVVTLPVKMPEPSAEKFSYEELRTSAQGH